MDSSNTKKRMRNAIIGGVVLLLITIGATYAYFMVTGGTGGQTPINVTSNTTDSFVFNISNDITITANMSNFNSTSETGKSQSDFATATATLRANNKTGEASRNYYLYLDITKNDLIYSINENTPELILQVKAPGASDYLTASDAATMDGNLKDLTYKSDVVDKNGNQYPGFDITGYEDLIAIVDNRPIEVVEGTPNNTVTESWEVRVVFVNYNDNQTSNGGRTVTAKLMMQEQKEELPMMTMMGIENDSYNGEIWQYKEKITKIVFENTKNRRTMDSDINGGVPFDLSKDKDGTVLAYIVKGSDLVNNGVDISGNTIEPFYPYTVYIQSKGNDLLLKSGNNLFSNFSNLSEIEGITRLDTSKATGMSKMFNNCRSLITLDLSKFDTTNVENMQWMFKNCSSLTTLNLNNFNTTNVTNMGSMFSCCSSLTTLNVSNFNTSKVTTMDGMFNECSSLTTLNLSNFNTQNVTTMSGMFKGCSGLTTLDVSNFNTTNVTDTYGMINMFWGCSSLTTLDLSNFNTSNIKSMARMFSGCSSLTTLDISNFNTTNVFEMNEMFQNCRGLTILDVSNFDTSKVTNMFMMFSDCSSLTTLNVSNFNTQNVTSMRFMFSGCSSLTTLNLSNFNTQNVTDMWMMFSGCSSLITLNVSNFNTTNVTNMGSMFDGCSSLTTLNVSNFNTSKVTDMNSMFNKCSSLTTLNISNFDTSRVTDMITMFNDCSNLVTIYVSEFNSTTGKGWSTSSVTFSSGMFTNCNELKGGQNTTYSRSNPTDKTYAHIDGGTSNPGYLTKYV